MTRDSHEEQKDTQPSKQKLFGDLFLPHIMVAITEFQNKGYRFAHYTSAENLISIVNRQELWLRTTRLMNDFQEIERGITIVHQYFGDKDNRIAAEFWQNLNKTYPEIEDEIKTAYDASLNDLRSNTFMSSVSVHLDEEDFMGRLSMWRAYAPRNGTALIIKPDVFYREENKLDVYSYPSLYWKNSEVFPNIDKIVRNFNDKLGSLQSLSREEVISGVIHLLRSFAICLKHPGFAEERELRLVFHPSYQTTGAVKKSVEICNGTPQIVYKIPLDEQFGTGLNNILDRVLIGPSNAVFEMRAALHDVLSDAQIDAVSEKLFFSEIPLRV